ncbi:unnamed protein product [Laminaria digitata]
MPRSAARAVPIPHLFCSRSTSSRGGGGGRLPGAAVGDDALAKAAGKVLRHLLLAEVRGTMLKLRPQWKSRAKPTTTVRWMLREPR